MSQKIEDKEDNNEKRENRCAAFEEAELYLKT